MGSLAVAYSLTAEITLISSNRSDLISKRSSEAYVANATKDSYEAAKRELSTMPPNLRTVAELNIILESARRNPQAYKSCTAINGSLGVSCPKISAELAKSRRKEQLEAILFRQAEKLEHAPTVTVDDPGSTAIKTYLEALGINLASSIISQWLNLVPVIALELGSALAAVLVSSVSHTADTRIESNNFAESEGKADANAAASSAISERQPRDAEMTALKSFLQHRQKSYQPISQLSQQQIRAVPEISGDIPGNNVVYPFRQRCHTRQSVEQEILRQLAAHGGSSADYPSQRQMAISLGLNTSTFNRAALSLEKQGRIRLEECANTIVMKIVS